MTDAELIDMLRNNVGVSKAACRAAKAAADRIEQLVATVEQLEAALTRANAANDIWSKNSRETFEAMVAMRDSINEFVPMPSLESDLLQGPENSVFCATVADAVVSALTRANAATAAAYEVAADACADYPRTAPDEAEWVRYDEQIEYSQRCIRALATPDQTAALDKLIAEAEAQVLEKAAIIANKLLVRTKFGSDALTEVVYSDFVGDAILAMIGEKK